MEEERQKAFFEGYKGDLRLSIPIDLFKDSTIKPLDREVYAIIDFLSYNFGYCFASNKKLMEMLHIASGTLQTSINKLVEKHYLFKETKYQSGATRRRLYTISKINEVKAQEERKNETDPDVQDILEKYYWWEED